MALRRPAEVFPPGEFLREELDARGWTQTDLADILGKPATSLNLILTGKRGISPEVARGLAAALGTSPEYWLNLESSYQLWRVKTDDNSAAVSGRARLYSVAPIREMLRRGWIEPSDSLEVLERRVLDFLEIKSLDDEPEFGAYAARKSASYATMTPAEKAWMARVKQMARAAPVGRFSKEGFLEALARLKLVLHVPQEIRHVPRILAEAGIRFVVVQPLPGSRIDGACFWLDGSPVVALSLRFDRIDYFWFTLLHELSHVSERELSFDVDLDSKRADLERPENELKADVFAASYLVPQQKLEGFIARMRPLYSTRKIEGFAQTLKVHPGVVVGQLHHRREVVWANFRRLLVPVREWVTANALTDGWGAASAARS